MVEQNIYLDGLFSSLADPVRRDVLQRLMQAQHTISQLAAKYDMSFAAVAKHIAVLERAKLITKHKQGREQVIAIAPEAIKDASYYLKQYEALWQKRFNTLDEILKEDI